jgi:hypothetical protein
MGPLEGKGDDRSLLHKALHLGEKRFIRDVGVVLAEERFVELEHFNAANFQAGAFEAGKDLPDEALRDRIGFEQDQSRFHRHGAVSLHQEPCPVNYA